MQEIKIFQVDAFTDKLFRGNPAAVCILNEWRSDNQMQSIAAENNLSETAFVIKKNIGEYAIRWFTPTVEVNLCGHATLASAFVLFEFFEPDAKEILFISPRAGNLSVRKNDQLLTLNFPTGTLRGAAIGEEMINAMGMAPLEAYQGPSDLLLLFESQEQVALLKPNFPMLSKLLGTIGVIATAPGKGVDFVSRYFAPGDGIDEDPVTGSAHTLLTPFWAKRLKKELLTAKQISKREGHLICKFCGDRVEISGNAILFLVGSIFIE